jgi:hypothetical protein
MQVRAVSCAWCNGEMRVLAPDVGGEGYFVLPRACRHCAGQNVVELVGTLARAAKRRRIRRGTTTQKIRVAALQR